ncbi:MAG: 2-C-methyl-D-erythritol 4-phosphate cytidylyltransferase [Steroidobacterales bacterium]
MHYWLVVPAAGAGRRYGAHVPKQHQRFAGQTILESALQPFLADARCLGGALVLAVRDSQRALLRQRLPSSFTIVDGGAERAHSVLHGLEALTLAEADDWVLVHDGARPALSIADLQRLLDAAGAHAVGGLLAVPIADTVKQADAHLACTATVARASLWLAQTPQMFRYAPLKRALTAAIAAGRMPTDEAQAMEWQGAQPLLVQARDGNPKITTAADLVVAEALLRARAQSLPVAEAARAVGADVRSAHGETR